MGALSAIVPAGTPTRSCLVVDIVDDDIALEGNETFVVEFDEDELEDRVVPMEPEQAIVTIQDNDEGEI